MSRVYTQVGEWYRLYNGGDGFNERMAYSLPDGHDIHCVAHWTLAAPEREFFKVPKFMVIGQAQIPLFLLETILRPDRYGQRGVILVDANWEPPADAEEAESIPVAKNDEQVIAKAGRHWKAYYTKVAEEWIAECNQSRVSGGVPRKASGFVTRALKLSGIIDPGDTILASVSKAPKEGGANAELLELVQGLKQEVAELKAGSAGATRTAPVQLSRTARGERKGGRE